MAVEKNLIQIQTELQNPSVRDNDLIKYANGSNANVPSFLALMEMSRRKQLEEGSKAYDASNQKTIKDQLANALTAPTQMRGALTGAPTGQVNPTAGPTGIAMGAAPTGQVNPTLAPAAPKPVQVGEITGAEGGLMSLPVNHFNADSYAGGGIVAFGDPARNPYETQLVSEPQERDPGKKVLSDSQILAELRSAGQSSDAAPAAAPQGRAPAGFQSILDNLPKVQANTMPTPKELTREEAYANIKENQRLAGVSEDPYSEVKKREAAIEGRQQKEYEQGGLDRLLAQMSAFATADPAKGPGYAAALSSNASRELEQKQNALRDKQEQVQLEFHKNLAKEEDSRRRGDATGIQGALDAQKKDQLAYAELQQKDQKLELDRQTIAAQLYKIQEDAGYHNRMASVAESTKPTNDEKTFLKIQSLIEHDPDIAALAKAKAMIPPDQPMYIAKQQEIYQKMAEHYKTNNVPVPGWLEQRLSAPTLTKTEDSSWSLPSWLGGSSKAPKTVSFGDLPN